MIYLVPAAMLETRVQRWARRWVRDPSAGPTDEDKFEWEEQCQEYMTQELSHPRHAYALQQRGQTPEEMALEICSRAWSRGEQGRQALRRWFLRLGASQQRASRRIHDYEYQCLQDWFKRIPDERGPIPLLGPVRRRGQQAGGGGDVRATGPEIDAGAGHEAEAGRASTAAAQAPAANP